MKVIAELYFYQDGSHMMAVLNKMSDLRMLFIPRDVYKILIKKDVPAPRNAKIGQPIKQELVKTIYIGDELTKKEVTTLVKNGTIVCCPYEKEINNRYIVLRDRVHISKVSDDAEIIPSNRISQGYITSLEVVLNGTK